MSYTNIWSDTSPTGAEAANTIDDIFRSLKVDIEQRFIDIFGTMPNFTADPLRPYGLKFTDAQDAVISLGDNTGTPRSIIWKNKAGAVTYATMSGTQFLLGTTMDLAVAATKKLFLDGGGNTYIYEISANVLDFFVGGTKIIELTTTYVDFRLSNVILSSTQKLFLDGGGDSYLFEASANQINIVAGGVTNVAFTSTIASFGSIDVSVTATKKLFLDGGGNSYIFEVSSDVIQILAGGVIQLQLSNTYAMLGNAGGSTLGFLGGTGSAQQTVTGSRAGNAALASLLTALANYNLIVNSSSA